MSSEEIRDYEKVRKQVEGKVNCRGEIINRRGKKVVPRKYHMTEDQFIATRNRWLFDSSTKSLGSLLKVGDKFFNPYRKAGIFYGQVQSLFCLGANKWHTSTRVISKVEEITSNVKDINGRNTWSKFSRKGPRMNDGVPSINAKDIKGRIHNNFRLMQRLRGIHPYGEKLKQVNSCIDIKRTGRGIWQYRLTTGGFESPVYDTSKGPYKKRGRKRQLNIEALNSASTVF